MKTLYQNLRIKYKLFALIAAIMAIFGILIVTVQQYTFEVYDREIFEQSAAALNQTSLSIENELRKVQQMSYRMATDEIIQSRLIAIKNADTSYDRFVAAAEIRERIVVIGGLDKYVRSVQLIDAAGHEYFVGRAGITYSEHYIARLEAETSATEGAVTWVLPSEDDSSLTAARLVRAYEEMSLEKLGVLAIRIDTDRLMRDMTGAGVLPANSQLLILHNSHAVYPHGQQAEPEVAQVSLIGSKSGFRTVKLEGSRFFMTFLSSSFTDWTYVTLIPYDDIFNRITTTKQLSLASYSVIFIIVILLTVRFARGITAPIEKLNTKMKRVQLGNFTYEADEDDRLMPMDEAGQLHRNFRIMLQRIDELIREDYIKQLAMKESEFKALQAQINPHFLYNTLETINWSAKAAGHKHISSMVESLGFLLRSSISLNEPLLTLKQELDIVGHYLNIQQIRFEERLTFELLVPAQLEDILIPKLSVQPLVENAVNHAMERMMDVCVIRVEAKEADDYIVVTVTDNGPGMDERMLERLKAGTAKAKGSGIGLLNIDERLKLLFGETCGLVITSERWEQTTIQLKLPKQSGGMKDV